MAVTRMNELDLRDKRVLIREDLNVPIGTDGQITSAQRLTSALPALRAARDAGARVMVLSHLGRPKEGQFDAAASLAPVATWLSAQLGQPVRLVRDYLDGVEVASGEVVLLENCRMNPGEAADDESLARRYAALCDIFVMDAFGTAHRAQASTHGVIRLAPQVAAGPLLSAELDALGKALEQPTRPLLAIVGGAKVSTKLDLLQNLVGKLDRLAIGGGMANTFLFAQGHDIGGSLAEKDMADTARAIMAEAEKQGCELLLPVDVVVATEVKPGADARTLKMGEPLSAEDKILDAGPQTVARLTAAMDASKTLIWNGPLGVFEVPPFDAATVAAAKHAADLAKTGVLIAVAGGGDTVAALNHAGTAEDMTFVSTAGGAFLEWMEGKPLPGVEALKA